jgi:hypothetical protein
MSKERLNNMSVDQKFIIELFNMLNQNKIEYVLLRNIGNELPNNYTSNKDIDILIHPNSKEKFHQRMKSNKWTQIKHPWDFGNNFVFLYAMDKFEMFTKDNINLDVCFQLPCRSINKGEWMPLDQMIIDSVWENKYKHPEFNWYQMCTEDQLVHLISRSIFDKKQFTDLYIIEIRALYKKANLEDLTNKLNLVFFKYTPNLIKSIESNNFEIMVNDYMQFSDY